MKSIRQFKFNLPKINISKHFGLVQKRSYSILIDNNFLNDDQKVIQETAFNFAKNELLPNAHSWDINKTFSKEHFRKCADMGFSSIYINENNGGSGLGRLEASIIFEALATGDVGFSAYLSIHNMCLYMIDQFGSEQQKKEWLPDLISMNRFSSYCLTEPDSGSDSKSMKTIAIDNGNEFVLNGTKAFISGGSVSDDYFVMCKTGENEISCIKVNKDSKGLSFGAQEKKMGWNMQPTSMVIMEDCRVPKGNLIGKKGDGFKIAMKGLDGGRINIASCSIGGAALGIDQAMSHIKTRKQFGKVLSDFQHIQFKIAELTTKLTASRLMTRSAARLIDENSDDKTVYSAMCKYFTTETCFELASEALQLHGGYGYLKDYHIERIFRDLRVNMILEGTNEIMRLIISRNIMKDN